MRPRTILAFSISLILTAPVLAQTSAKTNTASKVVPGQPVFVPAGDLKWTDLDPKGAPGVKVADLWGNHAKGAFGAYLKLPAGFATPLHTHTHAMKVIFLSGTYVQAPEGKAEVRLGPEMRRGMCDRSDPPSYWQRTVTSSWAGTCVARRLAFRPVLARRLRRSRP